MATSQFYKYAISLTQKLHSETQCFTKIHKSIRKYRRIYLSNVYLYILSQEKVKFKMAVLKIKKFIFSLNSSQFVLCADSRSVLIDDLAFRERIRKELLALNPGIEVLPVKQTMLDEYVDGSKEDMDDQREDSMVLNLLHLRNEYQEFAPKNKHKNFCQMYVSADLIDGGDDWVLITAEKLGEVKNEKKSFSIFKREKKELHTVKIYKKKMIEKDKSLLDRILRERRFLEEILSPYTPTLHRCIRSGSSLYCITELYKGTRLKAYLQNQTLSKNQFKSLLSQIVMALGQLHECNVVYNTVTVDGIFVLDEGYIFLNDFSNSCEINAESTNLRLNEKVVPPEGLAQGEGRKVNGCWDWYNFGQLIFLIKEGRRWKEGDSFPWEKEPELCTLTKGLLQTNPQQRLGYRNDYHEVLGHPYFKNINKKQLATRSCEPLKKFFTPNPQKIIYSSDGEELPNNDASLSEYEFSRQLE